VRKIKARDPVIIAAFSLILGLPLLQTFFPLIPVPALQENRNKAAWPDFSWTDLESGALKAGLNNYFNDHFGFRDSFIRGRHWITYYGFGLSTNAQVIIGKDGFLFIADSLNDYHRVPTFSPAEADRIARNFKDIQNELAARGTRFLLVVGPNTNTIYPESMPVPRKNPAGVSNLDLLKAACEKYGVDNLDLVPALLKQKSSYPVYYKNDTHWNGIAGVVAANEILGRLDPERRFHGDLRITGVRPETRNGDLNILLGIDPRDTSVLPVTEYQTPALKLPKLVWLHDSYSWAIFPYVKPFIADARVHHYTETASYSVIAADARGARYFIFEITERALPFLSNMRYDFLHDVVEMPEPHFDLDPLVNTYEQQLTVTQSPNGSRSIVVAGNDPHLIWDMERTVRGRFVVLELTTTDSLPFQLFWRNPGDKAFMEAKSMVIYANPFGSKYCFDIRKIGPVTALRLDPGSVAGLRVELKSIKVYFDQ
jgi:hypothetical protein